MAKAGRGSDQFMVRLPSGMRDRIASAAEKRGRSMNSEIVRALELAFPEPISLTEKLTELGYLFTAMSKVRGAEGAIEVLIDELVDAAESVAKGAATDVPDPIRNDVEGALETIKRIRFGISEMNRKRVDVESYRNNSEDE